MSRTACVMSFGVTSQNPRDDAPQLALGDGVEQQRTQHAAAPTSSPESSSMVSLNVGVAKRQEIRCAWGRYKKQGNWLVTSFGQFSSVFASTQLDFRDLNLAPGITEFALDAWFSRIDIIVPPGLQVELHCGHLLSSQREAGSAGPPMTGPSRSLKISGKIVCSILTIHRLSSGESIR